MSFFRRATDSKSSPSNDRYGLIDYGGNKGSEGGHDHRYNRGDDRTPSQKSGDAKRRKT